MNPLLCVYCGQRQTPAGKPVGLSRIQGRQHLVWACSRNHVTLAPADLVSADLGPDPVPERS